MPSKKQPIFYGDFETRPIGGNNPYHECVDCGVSVPEINFELTGHAENCPYRLRKEAELAEDVPDE